jgi:2-C-methyl-D-erythritol 4-phosphate cytidylyltransferase
MVRRGPADGIPPSMEKRQKDDSSGILAVIPSAGSGVRMESRRPKQFLDLGGVPLLAVTLRAFQLSPVIQEINLVVPGEERDYCRREIVEKYGLEKVKQVVCGGERRQDSVRLGLEASEGSGFGLAVIHDGVRPLVGADLIRNVVEAARKTGAAIAALPAKDTVKEVSEERVVRRTHDRRRIWLVQTPQAFRFGEILAAHRRALTEGWGDVTDDALLLERMGVPVRVVEGAEENIKVTTPHDLELARFLLGRKERIAQGA